MHTHHTCTTTCIGTYVCVRETILSNYSLIYTFFSNYLQFYTFTLIIVLANCRTLCFHWNLSPWMVWGHCLASKPCHGTFCSSLHVFLVCIVWGRCWLLSQHLDIPHYSNNEFCYTCLVTFYWPWAGMEFRPSWLFQQSTILCKWLCSLE